MELEAAKQIGAGLATIGLAGVGVGIGNIFASYVAAGIRNPAAAPRYDNSLEIVHRRATTARGRSLRSVWIVAFQPSSANHC